MISMCMCNDIYSYFYTSIHAKWLPSFIVVLYLNLFTKPVELLLCYSRQVMGCIFTVFTVKKEISSMSLPDTIMHDAKRLFLKNKLKRLVWPQNISSLSIGPSDMSLGPMNLVAFLHGIHVWLPRCVVGFRLHFWMQLQTVFQSTPMPKWLRILQ